MDLSYEDFTLRPETYRGPIRGPSGCLLNGRALRYSVSGPRIASVGAPGEGRGNTLTALYANSRRSVTATAPSAFGTMRPDGPLRRHQWCRPIRGAYRRTARFFNALAFLALSYRSKRSCSNRKLPLARTTKFIDETFDVGSNFVSLNCDSLANRSSRGKNRIDYWPGSRAETL